MSTVTDVSPAPPAADRAGALTRWSDRLSPILVREVQQQVKGRMFALTVFGALLVVVIIAIVVASEYADGDTTGRGAFDAGLATLAPLLLFVVPMQAYQSMQAELRGGMIEQLLLTELRPLRIVLGKLGAAMVQFVVYVSVIAPLLATSYLLRGVDLPTIALSLGFALVFCVAATSFAVAAALQGTMPAMRPIANLGMAFGLGMASMAMLGYIGSGSYLRDVGWMLRSSEFAEIASFLLLLATAATILLSLVAQAFLAHAFENRSTGFRVYLLGSVPLWFGWIHLFVSAGSRDDVICLTAWLLTLLGCVFGVFLTTEQHRLSPRVRAHVPRSRLSALVVAPLLPGRDRGMLCLVLFFVLLGAVSVAIWPAAGGFTRMNRMFAVLTGCAASYAMIFLSLAKWTRGHLPATVQGNHLARFLVPILILAGSVLPLLFDVLVNGHVREWHWGHVLNPFWTAAEATGGSGAWMRAPLWWAGGICAALQVPSLLRGVREVLAASKERTAAEAQRSG